MKFGRKLVGLALATALVAVPAVAAGSAAQAAPKGKKVNQVALISFKKEYAGIIKLIQPVKPTKFVGSKMTFPVTKTDGQAVFTKGGIGVGGLELINPVIGVNTPSPKMGTILFTNSDGDPLPLFYIEHFKSKKDKKKGAVIWQGDVHLADNQAFVDLLNSVLGTQLEPGMGIGQIRVTLKI